MNLYLAVRWGSDQSEDGPDGEDTNFLVRAPSRDEAASIVDAYLANQMTHERVEPVCHRLVELGEDGGKITEAGIVIGPWIAFAIGNTGDVYKTWMREGQTDYRWKDMHE